MDRLWNTGNTSVGLDYTWELGNIVGTGVFWEIKEFGEMGECGMVGTIGDKVALVACEGSIREGLKLWQELLFGGVEIVSRGGKRTVLDLGKWLDIVDVLEG